MIDKLELKSSHAVVYTVYVADVESIFYCKPDDPDILTVLMKDGKRLYCDEVCPIDSLQEDPASIWHDGCEIPKSGTNILIIRKDENDSNYPPIAGCFHGTNSRLDGRNWGYYNGFCYNEIEPPVKWVYIDDILNLSNVERTVKNWKEEPVSDDFKLFEKEYLEKEEDEILCVYDRHAGLVDGAQWQKLQMIEKACKWLDENAAKYLIDKSVHGVKMTGLDISFTEDFKKAMEDDQHP